MRILHLTTSVDVTTGGVASVVLGLAFEQARRGDDVRIVTADLAEGASFVADRLKQAGIVHVHPDEPLGFLGSRRRVRGLIERAMDGERPDVGHVHGMWQAMPHHGAAYCAKRGIPYAYAPHGMLDPYSLRANSALKKRLFLAMRGRSDLNRASAMHYTAPIERDLVVPMGLRPPAHIIDNGIDWGEFETLPEAGAFRRAHQIGDRPLVTFLSRLHPKKGLDILLPAFAKGAPEEAFLALVGPGDEEYVASLKAEAERLGIAGRTVFTGMLKGADRLPPLADADLFCLPSYQENFGIAVIEALAVSTPVLISDQVNIWKDVTEQGVGHATRTDIDEVAAKLGEMLADRRALPAMGERGREWVKGRYAWPSVAAATEVMYRSMSG